MPFRNTIRLAFDALTRSASISVLLRHAASHEFALEIQPKQASSHRCDADITTRIVEADATHAVIRQQALLTGKGFIGDCH